MGDKSKGYVPIFRCIVDNWVFQNVDKHNTFSAWIDLILMVNHKDAKTYIGGELVTVKRGQTVTSVRKLSERWGWRYEKTVKYLEALEKDEMITRERVKSGTLLAIVNYSFYGDVRNGNGAESGTETEQKAEHFRSEKRNTFGAKSGTKTETNNNDNNDNNVNNENNENNENNGNKREGKKKPPRARYGEYNHVLLTEEEHNKLLDQLGERATTEYIKRVDEYCQQTGKRYQDYYLTILHWWNKDGGSKQEESKADRALRWLKEGGFGNGNG